MYAWLNFAFKKEPLPLAMNTHSNEAAKGEVPGGPHIRATSTRAAAATAAAAGGGVHGGPPTVHLTHPHDTSMSAAARMSKVRKQAQTIYMYRQKKTLYNWKWPHVVALLILIFRLGSLWLPFLHCMSCSILWLTTWIQATSG